MHVNSTNIIPNTWNLNSCYSVVFSMGDVEMGNDHPVHLPHIIVQSYTTNLHYDAP